MRRENANTVLSAVRISKAQSVRLRINDKRKFAFVITSLIVYKFYFILLCKDLHVEEDASLKRLNTA